MFDSGVQSSLRPKARRAVSRARHQGELRTVPTVELLGRETAADALRMRDAAIVEIALRRALLEAPAWRVADAGRGLRVAHQQRGAGAQLAHEGRVVGPQFAHPGRIFGERRQADGAGEADGHLAAGGGTLISAKVTRSAASA